VIRHTFTILEEHLAKLKELLFRDGKESGALLLCGRSRHPDPWTGDLEERALVREVVPVAEDAFSARTATSMTWSTTPLFSLTKRAMLTGQAICIAHSHPAAALAFSGDDDVADKESFEIVFNRLESDRPHFSLVMTPDGEVMVRAYGPDLVAHPVEMTRVVGTRLLARYPGRGHGVSAEAFDRQARTFGAASVEDLSKLRIGIVGCGGTGSAVASLLARIGVSRLALIDADRVDTSNLNRLHFSHREDAILHRPKVDVLAEEIAKIGLVEKVVRLPHYADDPQCRDALCTCDVIFGCTDDHLGRNLLNRLAHFYLIPVIDLGLLIEPAEDGGYDTFDARMTVVQPGAPCQVCRKLIDSQRMLEEGMRRDDPERYEQHRRAGYVRGADVPSPAVVTFTTEVATMAVNELFHRLTGFRGASGHCAERIRRLDHVKDADTVPGGRADPACKLCGRRAYDGRGDVDPFVDMA
jgi:molybdopterin/thiamine biosynthesis adenylyltransferase